MIRPRMRTRLPALMGLALLPAVVTLWPQPGAVPVPRAPVVTLHHDWSKYCGNLAMTGTAPADARLAASNVGKLQLLWRRQLFGTIASSPSLSRGTLYIGDWSGTLWALDAGTGETRASANLGTTEAAQCNPPSLGVTSAPDIVNGTVYVAGGDSFFYALDAGTLTVLWRTQLGDNSAAGGYYGWCSPAFVGGKVLQGVSSNCDTPFVPGKLVALDPATGIEMSEAVFVPEGVVGGGVWTSPAVDEASGKIFVTTGSALNLSDGLSFSIVRLSLDTLAIEDSWKVDPMGLPDSDWGSSPTLFSDALGRSLVGAGQKDGHYYAFRRDNLAAGPVWTAYVSRTGNCPQCGQGTLSTAAFDGKRLYVGGGAPPGVPFEQQGGTVLALEPTTGAVLWRRSFASGPAIAPVSAVPGAVFATVGNQAVALDAETGDPLWYFNTQAGCYGGIAISQGRIYFGDTSGNLYAFGLPPVTLLWR